MALLLQKRGITRIHPLEGGIDAWLENKFPFERPALLKSSAAVSVTARPSAAEAARTEREIV